MRGLNEARAIITSRAPCQQKIALGSPNIRVKQRKRRRPYDDARSRISCDLEALSALHDPVALNSALRASSA